MKFWTYWKIKQLKSKPAINSCKETKRPWECFKTFMSLVCDLFVICLQFVCNSFAVCLQIVCNLFAVCLQFVCHLQFVASSHSPVRCRLVWKWNLYDLRELCQHVLITVWPHFYITTSLYLRSLKVTSTGCFVQLKHTFMFFLSTASYWISYINLGLQFGVETARLALRVASKILFYESQVTKDTDLDWRRQWACRGPPCFNEPSGQ